MGVAVACEFAADVGEIAVLVAERQEEISACGLILEFGLGVSLSGLILEFGLGVRGGVGYS